MSADSTAEAVCPFRVGAMHLVFRFSDRPIHIFRSKRRSKSTIPSSSSYSDRAALPHSSSNAHVFESFLLKRVPRVAGMHPATAHALSRLSASADIGNIVEETGYSHRHFIKLFRETVRVAPRLYTRLLRFQQTLKFGVDKTRGRWIDVALEAGYADQSHFNREFREMTGLSPTEYLSTGEEIPITCL